MEWYMRFVLCGALSPKRGTLCRRASHPGQRGERCGFEEAVQVRCTAWYVNLKQRSLLVSRSNVRCLTPSPPHPTCMWVFRIRWRMCFGGDVHHKVVVFLDPNRNQPPLPPPPPSSWMQLTNSAVFCLNSVYRWYLNFIISAHDALWLEQTMWCVGVWAYVWNYFIFCAQYPS